MSTEDYLIPFPVQRVIRRPDPTEREAGPDGEDDDRLVAGLAHNLRNLVQVVNGNLELIAARAEDEVLLRYVANAQAAAKLITELAQGLEDGPPA